MAATASAPVATTTTTTSSSTHSLLERYQLDKELASGWCKGRISMLDTLTVSIYALDCAIVHRIDHVVHFVINFYAGNRRLSEPTQARSLTPLHFAAISGNLEAAEQLIKAGADSDAQDVRGWAPIHHAALAADEAMMNLLKVHGLCARLRTLSGATYQHILRFTQPQPATGPTHLLWRNARGEAEPLSCEQFRKLTEAEYTEENQVSPELLLAEWVDPTPRDREWSFAHTFKPAYLSFLENPPRHILAEVTHDSQGRPLQMKPGLGLFAARDYAPREIIGEYVGTLEDRDVENAYVLGRINSLHRRNGMPQINDGFNNLTMILLHDVEGLPTRRLLVTTEAIRRGDQFCWNYGMNDMKIRRYVELRPKEVRDFMCREKLRDLIHALVSTCVKEQSFELCVRANKFRYVLETPVVLFLMTFEGVIEAAKAQELLTLAYTMGCIPYNGPEHLKSIAKVAAACYSIRKQISVCFPKTAALYVDFIATLPAKVGSRFTLQLAAQANRFLDNKLSLLRKDGIPLHIELPEVDDYMVTVWNTEVAPKNAEAISLVQSRTTP